MLILIDVRKLTPQVRPRPAAATRTINPTFLTPLPSWHLNETTHFHHNNCHLMTGSKMKPAVLWFTGSPYGSQRSCFIQMCTRFNWRIWKGGNRWQYVTQVTLGPLILTIHRRAPLAGCAVRNYSMLGCDRSGERQPILDICREAPLLYNNVPPAPFLYLLYIPSVIRFRFNGRRSLLQSALRRFILPQLVDLWYRCGGWS